MKLPSIPYLLEVFSHVIRRFPFVMLAAGTGVVTAMMLIEENYDDKNTLLPKILLTALLGLPLLLSAAIASEKWRLDGLKKWLPAVVSLILLAVYFFSINISEKEPDINTMIRFAGLNLCAHLLVAYIPYLDKTAVEDFWEYNKRLFGNFMVGAFYSIIIHAGLSIAILAVDQLFDLRINEKIYGHLFVFVAGIINTSFFLANFPTQFEGIATSASPYTLAIKNLSKFILIPIVGIYFLILYAYSFKILATWNLPHGWVSSLVLGFSVAGIFTYLLNYVLVNYDENKLVHGYRKWFFYVLFPMVLLLFVAIGKRLSDYAVTEERFIVATAGVWLFLLSLYFIVSKKDNIKFIPISLSVFSLLTVLGPFNAFRISGNSQAERLTMLLEKNGMLANGKAQASQDSLNQADAENIRSILYYMREHEHFDKIKDLFPGSLDTIKYSDWEAVENILRQLKVGQDQGSAGITCGYNFQIVQEIDVAGFDKFWRVQAFGYSVQEAGYSGFALTKNKNGLDYFVQGELRATVDLLPSLEALQKKFNCYGNIQQVEDVSFDWKNPEFEFRLLMENVEFRTAEPLEITSWSGMVLLRAHRNE